MAKDIKAIFQKYLSQDGNIIERDRLTLNQWYELEETAHEAKKTSGDNYEKWIETTGGAREFKGLLQEIEVCIKKLGGKILAEREQKWTMKCSECSQEFTYTADSEEVARPKLEEQLKVHQQEKHPAVPPKNDFPLPQDENNNPPKNEDNQPPFRSTTCPKCKKRCKMFTKNWRELGKENIHCPKCAQDLVGKSYFEVNGSGFGIFSEGKIAGIRHKDCSAEKAEDEAIRKWIETTQEKYKSAIDFLKELKDKLLKPSQGATAYNLPNSDKAYGSGNDWRFCVYVPIWVKYLSKEDAQAAKEKLTPLLTASEKEKHEALRSLSWLSYKVKYCDRIGYHSFADNLEGFLAEREEVLADKVVNDNNQNQALSQKEKWEKIGQINSNPQSLQKSVKEEIVMKFLMK